MSSHHGFGSSPGAEFGSYVNWQLRLVALAGLFVALGIAFVAAYLLYIRDSLVGYALAVVAVSVVTLCRLAQRQVVRFDGSTLTAHHLVRRCSLEFGEVTGWSIREAPTGVTSLVATTRSGRTTDLGRWGVWAVGHGRHRDQVIAIAETLNGRTSSR